MKVSGYIVVLLALLVVPLRAQNWEEIVENLIKGYFTKYQDPMLLNDTINEWNWNGIIYRAETRGIVLVGFGAFKPIDIVVNPFTLGFEFKLGGPGQFFSANGGLDFYIDTSLVWPTPIFGNGDFFGEIIGIEMDISGRLQLLPPGVHNLEYTLNIANTALSFDGLMDGDESQAKEILEHLNSNGPSILTNIDEVNHEIYLYLLTEQINEYLAQEMNNFKMVTAIPQNK